MVSLGRPRTRIDITCQNPDCGFFLMEEGKDIVKHGFNTAGNQVYHCKRCGRFFTETINTPLYHRHLPKADVVLICKLAVEKLGVRAIERVTGKHRDTVSRVLRDVADYAGPLNDEVLRNIATGTFEVDELWTMVEKKRSTSPRT